MTKITKVLGQAALLVVFVGFCVSVSRAADVDVQKMYKEKCEFCHGADGKPTATGEKMGAKDFHSPEVSKKTDAELTDIVKKGVKKMPGFAAKLSDDQVKQLVTYCRDLSKK